jgi:hypothetical protein
MKKIKALFEGLELAKDFYRYVVFKRTIPNAIAWVALIALLPINIFFSTCQFIKLGFSCEKFMTNAEEIFDDMVEGIVDAIEN